MTTTTFPLEIQNKVFQYLIHPSPEYKRDDFNRALSLLMQTGFFGYTSLKVAAKDTLEGWLKGGGTYLLHSEIEEIKDLVGITPPAPKVGTLRIVLDIEVENVSEGYGLYGPGNDDGLAARLAGAVTGLELPKMYGGNGNPRRVKSAAWKTYAAGIDLTTKAPSVRTDGRRF